MTQTLRPNSDDSVSSNWNKTTGSFFYECVDETSASDSDYLYTDNNSSGGIRLGLTDPSIPTAGTYTVRYRIAKTNSGTVTGTGATPKLEAIIRDSGGIVAIDTERTPNGTWTTYTWNPDLSGVSDWNSLQFYIGPTSTGGTTNPRGIALSWVEVEIPAAMDIPIVAASGTFALSRGTATFPVTRKLTVTSGAFVLDADETGLRKGSGITLDEASFVLAGNAAGLRASRLLSAASGSFVLTGNAANTIVGKIVYADSVPYTMAFTDVLLAIREPNGWNIPKEEPEVWTESGAGAGEWQEYPQAGDGWAVQ